MKRILSIILLTTAITGSIASTSDSVVKMKSTCTGSKNCNTCKNCKYCKHCAKEGGKCGVCK